MINKEYINKLKTEALNAVNSFNSSKQTKTVRIGDEKNDQGNNGSTYLYIRAFDGDTGNRPFPAGTVCWLSPDIQVFDAAGNNVTATDIVAGKNHTVKVTVCNNGDMDCNSCTVDLFIVVPSIGLNSNTILPVGIQTTAVRGHSSETIEFSFVATQEGHSCLYARAYSLIVNDYPTDLTCYNVMGDRHIGQRNLNIVKQGTKLKFNVTLGPIAQNTDTVITVTNESAPIKKLALPALKKYSIVKKTIAKDAVKVHMVLETLHQAAITGPVGKLSDVRLGEKITPGKIIPPAATATLVPAKQLASNKWAPKPDSGPSTYQIEIPALDLKSNEMVPFHVKLTDSKTGNIIGGITYLVTA